MAPARKDDDIRVGNDGYCKVYLKKAFSTESVIHAVHENIEKKDSLTWDLHSDALHAS